MKVERWFSVCRRCIGFIVLGTLTPLLSGCDTLSYFHQAASGQWQILHARNPIASVIANSDTDPEVRRKLALVEQTRQFAAQELHLDIGDSYTSYVALDRSYVVWNVVAAPEFSITPMHWCFPIAGCVSYRGYFDEAEATRYAAKLQAEGMETYVGGVDAYSTLGWFDDPVLSTFVKRSDAALSGLVIHELTHRTLYVQNDSTFNESYATVVEQEGLKRWLLQQHQPEVWARYEKQSTYEDQFVALILDYRSQLEALYAKPLSDEEKRKGKLDLANAVKSRYQHLRDEQWQGFAGYDRWMGSGLNNAQISTIATYHAYIPAFKALLAQCHDDMASLHDKARALADLDKEARTKALQALVSDRPH